MRIAALIIYKVVTLSGRNISGCQGPGLCSKVLGILNCPSPVTALPVPPERRVAGCEESAAVRGEELGWWIHGQHSFHPAESLVLAGASGVARRPNAAIRQQFLFALLENCSSYAHLVLRCVRGGNGSLHDVAAPWGVKPRPDSGIELGTRRVTHLCAQPELQNLPAGSTETSIPESERLWAELASRQVRISVCEGERP
jgi:hypothetical protein